MKFLFCKLHGILPWPVRWVLQKKIISMDLSMQCSIVFTPAHLDILDQFDSFIKKPADLFDSISARLHACMWMFNGFNRSRLDRFSGYR